jgi:hypothetical protein
VDVEQPHAHEGRPDTQAQDEPSEQAKADDGKTSLVERLGQGLGFIIVIALLVVAVILVVGLFRGPKINPGPHPSWLATIFSSRSVVGAVRIAIIFAAAYLVASVCALIAGRQWLTRVGPVEVASSVKGLASERDQLASDLAEARDTIDRLEGRLSETTQVYEETAKTLNQTLEYIATMADGGDEK